MNRDAINRDDKDLGRSSGGRLIRPPSLAEATPLGTVIGWCGAPRSKRHGRRLL
jgi:hypothetical protein